MTSATKETAQAAAQDRTGSITQDEIETLLQQQQSNGDIGLDETFEILKNSRRRDVLMYLAGAEDGTATLSELAEHVAAKENSIETDQLSSKQRKRVYIGLYQCHLPKLDDVGAIAYDKDRGTVELEKASQIFSYLKDVDDTSENSRTMLYGSLGVSAVVMVGLFGPGFIDGVPTAGWALLSTAALVAVALYHAELL